MWIFFYFRVAFFPLLAVSALVTAAIWRRNAGALIGRIAMVAAACGFYVHGQFAISRLPAHTPGPFFLWLFWGFSLPIGLLGASFALNSDPGRSKPLPGRVTLALALMLSLVLTLSLGPLGALVFITVFAIGYWVCVLARKAAAPGPETVDAAPDGQPPDRSGPATPSEGDPGGDE